MQEEVDFPWVLSPLGAILRISGSSIARGARERLLGELDDAERFTRRVMAAQNVLHEGRALDIVHAPLESSDRSTRHVEQLLNRAEELGRMPRFEFNRQVPFPMPAAVVDRAVVLPTSTLRRLASRSLIADFEPQVVVRFRRTFPLIEVRTVTVVRVEAPVASYVVREIEDRQFATVVNRNRAGATIVLPTAVDVLPAWVKQLRPVRTTPHHVPILDTPQVRWRQGVAGSELWLDPVPVGDLLALAALTRRATDAIVGGAVPSELRRYRTRPR